VRFSVGTRALRSPVRKPPAVEVGEDSVNAHSIVGISAAPPATLSRWRTAARLSAGHAPKPFWAEASSNSGFGGLGSTEPGPLGQKPAADEEDEAAKIVIAI